MSRTEEVELTNMCMICDGRGNVLVQDKKNHPTWHGWNFPGGHVEAGEYVTPSVIREMREETGLTVKNPKLCGIKEFHRSKDGKRYIVFLYLVREFTGELRSSGEGEVFWYPLADLEHSDKLIPGFREMIQIFTQDHLSEVYYIGNGADRETVIM